MVKNKKYTISTRMAQLYIATEKAKSILKPGDRVGLLGRECNRRKITITFSHLEKCWIVSKTGIDNYSPLDVYSINGTKINLTDQSQKL